MGQTSTVGWRPEPRPGTTFADSAIASHWRRAETPSSVSCDRFASGRTVVCCLGPAGLAKSWRSDWLTVASQRTQAGRYHGEAV